MLHLEIRILFYYYGGLIIIFEKLHKKFLNYLMNDIMEITKSPMVCYYSFPPSYGFFTPFIYKVDK